MTDTSPTGRFDVRATGELCGSFDGADERARLLQALNGDRDLCSALLCGDEQLLCRSVEWAQAQAFATLMRDCGVVTEVMRVGEEAQMLPEPEPEPEPELELELTLAAEEETETVTPVAAMAAAEKPVLMLVSTDTEPVREEQESVGSTWATSSRTRRPVVYEAEEVIEPQASAPAAQASVSRAADVVSSDGGGDIPMYLLEADARERNERLRLRRRWGLASAVVVLLALIALFAGGERTVSSQQVYVHVLASAVHAEVDGVVAELLVQPRQPLQAGEALAVIAPEGGVRQRHIEAAPTEGTVDQIVVSSGQKVRRGEPLLTLAQPGSAYLLAYFSAEQLKQLPERAPVKIELDDFPGQPLLGRLAASGPEPDARGRRSVRIDFEDQPSLLQRLRSGMAGSVTVRLDNGVD